MWEAHRRDAFRAFRIHLVNLTVETVFAHFWDNTSGPGHLNFYTIEPSGRQTISRAYGCNHWWKVEEVRSAKTDRAFSRMAQMEMFEKQKGKQSTRGVH